MKHAVMRSRILAVIGPGALSVFVACGGESDSDGSGSDAGVGGGGTGGSGAVLSCFSPQKAWEMYGTGGAGGSGATGGAAGAAGAAGAMDAGAADADSDAGVGGDAGADAEVTCPAALPEGFCSGYNNGQLVDGQCCYNHWNGGNSCGRPFMVAGAPRVAGTGRRDDWLEALPTAAELRLDAATRAALLGGWLEDARLEHASVASFARLVLQLLAFGAPSELVSAAQRAGADEIAHARGCFALASRFADGPLGPTALALDGALPSPTLAEAAAAAVHEGCVGETLAAIQATEQLSLATDPATRAVLERIARDEADHAELSWRFVRWALETGGDEVRHAVREAFREAFVRVRSATAEAPADVDLGSLHAHGRLSESERLRCHRAAVAEVLAPCAEALLATVAARSSEGGEALAVA